MAAAEMRLALDIESRDDIDDFKRRCLAARNARRSPVVLAPI